MSEIITTLHKKDDSTVNVYPNIKADNIPSGAITTAKIANGAVTEDKLEQSVKDSINMIFNFYDPEEDKFTVGTFIANDEAYFNDNVKVTGNLDVSGDINTENGIYINNNEVKILKRHSIEMRLRDEDDPSDYRDLAISFISSILEPITTFNELMNECSKMIYHAVVDRGLDYTGYINNVDFDLGNIAIYVGKIGSSDMGASEEIEFNSADSIVDVVTDL